MTLGDLRQFLASIDAVPDEAVLKARVTLGHQLRSVTVQEDDVGFRDYVRAVGSDKTATESDESSDAIV